MAPLTTSRGKGMGICYPQSRGTGPLLQVGATSPALQQGWACSPHPGQKHGPGHQGISLPPKRWFTQYHLLLWSLPIKRHHWWAQTGFFRPLFIPGQLQGTHPCITKGQAACKQLRWGRTSPSDCVILAVTAWTKQIK